MKKIGILSSRHSDLTSDLVFDWIKFLGHTPRKIIISKIKDDCFMFNRNLDLNINLNIKDIDAIWFRRSDKNILNLDQLEKFPFETVYEINKSHENDDRILDSLIFKQFEGLWKVTSPSQVRVSKLDVLKKAADNGLNTPEFILTNDKSELVNFFKNNGGDVIVKDLDFPFHSVHANIVRMVYVNRLNKTLLKSLPDRFPISFFQREIKKKFEIRTFVLKSKLYSMAIFSQNDSQTSVDFRRYNTEKPNQRVPFNLPKSVEMKILKLFKSLNLETGSVDIIYGQDKKYYFLEINPVGQFGMVSFPCNYPLEFEIAKILCHG